MSEKSGIVCGGVSSALITRANRNITMTIHTNVLIASPFVLVVARVPAEGVEYQVEVGERDVGVHARFVADMAELYEGGSFHGSSFRFFISVRM
jgi:hypothetical protein